MMKFFWLSFATDACSLGCILAEAEDFDLAVEGCSIRKCNPGGEVVGWEIPAEVVKRHGRFELWKLYSREDIARIDGAEPIKGTAGVDAILCETCNK